MRQVGYLPEKSIWCYRLISVDIQKYTTTHF